MRLFGHFLSLLNVVIKLISVSGLLASCNRLFRIAFLSNHNKITTKASALKIDDEMCIISTTLVEGPYYLKSPIRKDIREGKNGIQLNLRFALLKADNCTPVTNAVVEIWHCDAQGNYSGYPEDMSRNFKKVLKFAGGIKSIKGHVNPINEKTYLRGAQITDSKGVVDFITIFPGWYEPRATHIHFKVTFNETEQVNIQYFFEKDVTDKIYSSYEQYMAFGKCPYNVHNDIALRNIEKVEGVILKSNWTENNIIESTAKIGIKRK